MTSGLPVLGRPLKARVLASLSQGVAIVLSLGFLTSAAPIAIEVPGARIPIRIAKLEPAPNYRPGPIKAALSALADGRVTRFPMWVRPGGVTWSGITPVVVLLDIDRAGPVSGFVEVHSARGDFAGVRGPRRIDVYAGTRMGGYRHAAELTVGPDEIPDRNQRWLRLPFSDARGRVAVVLHAAGHYLALDEIRVEVAKGGPKPSGRGLSHLRAVREESLGRLRAALENAARCAPAKSLPPGTEDGRQWSTRVLPPYAALSRCEALAEVPGPELVGFSFEKEPVVLAIENRSGQEASFVIAMDPPARGDAAALSRLVPVLVADGQVVLDAIVPLKEAIRIPPGEIGYVWIDLSLRHLRIGRDRIVLRVTEKSSGTERRVVVPTLIAPLTVRASDFPEAFPWPGLREPISHNVRGAITDLVENRVSAFMIPPWRIPVVGNSSAKSAQGRVRFIDEVKEFARHGQVLLFLNTPAHLGGCTGAAAETLRSWAAELAKLISTAGVPFGAWALYPVDEPRDEKLRNMRACAEAIKQADPRIRVYANPDAGTLGAKTLPLLEELRPFVDIWQPRARLVQSGTAGFFRRQETFWIYDNPRSPSKSELPDFYRTLAWRAWRVGASGVGFWSYDDTRNSSAWDDLDGIRPDWAVVYEASPRPAPSRRWRAFRDGLEDFAALHALQRDPLHRYNLDKLRSNVLPLAPCQAGPRFSPGSCRETLIKFLGIG